MNDRLIAVWCNNNLFIVTIDLTRLLCLITHEEIAFIHQPFISFSLSEVCGVSGLLQQINYNISGTICGATYGNTFDNFLA